MDLTQLQYFQILAREENMSRTAEKLHVAQPAISASLSRLEKELDTFLFDRKGKKIILNSSGKIFLNFADDVLGGLEQTKKLLARQKEQSGEELTFACNSYMATQELFFSYMALHPLLRLKQYSVASTSIVAELKNEQCDFVVSTVPVDNDRLGALVLTTQDIGLIVPASHRFASRSWIDLAEAAKENFVCMQRGTAFRQTTDELCRLAGFEPFVIMEYFPSQLIQTVERSNGVALGICYEERKHYFETALRFIPIRSPVCQRTVTLLWKREREQEKRIRDFIAFSREYPMKRD